MTTILLAFVLAFLVAVVATRLVMVLAWRWGVVDKPDGYRKVHRQWTPKLGGLAVYGAFLAPLIALSLFPSVSTVSELFLNEETFPKLVGLVVGGLLALGLGVADDIFDLHPRWKLLWQILIACVVYRFGFKIEGIGNPFGAAIWLGNLSFPVTLFWFVACMNAVNLLDGIDGLAAGASVFVALTLFLVSLLFSNVLGMFLMACLSGAALGFLVFNFPPARIFLGDSGSLLLGFLIAALSLMGATLKASTAVALFVPVVALGLPIFDTALAILRRWYRRLPLSSPDQEHIHHVLVSMGYSPRRAVLMLYLTCAVLGGAALLISVGRREVFILVVGTLTILVFVCVRIFSTMRFGDLLSRIAQDGSRREQSRATRVEFEQQLGRMRHVKDVGNLWRICGQAFETLGLDQARLDLVEPGGDQRRSFEWTRLPGEPKASRDVPSAREGPGDADFWMSRLGLRWDDVLLGVLEVRAGRGGDSTLLETTELLDRLQAEMACQVRRLRLAPELRV